MLSSVQLRKNPILHYLRRDFTMKRVCMYALYQQNLMHSISSIRQIMTQPHLSTSFTVSSHTAVSSPVKHAHVVKMVTQQLMLQISSRAMLSDGQFENDMAFAPL